MNLSSSAAHRGLAHHPGLDALGISTDRYNIYIIIMNYFFYILHDFL